MVRFPQTLPHPRSLYVETIGFASLLFLRTGYLLLFQRNHQQYHNRNTARGLFVYLCIAFSLLTTTTICNTVIKTRALIDYREYPGGPAEYLEATYFHPPGAIAAITGILVNYMTQGLMVRFSLAEWSGAELVCLLQLYRCYVIFKDMIWFVATPVVLFCSVIGAPAWLIFAVCGVTQSSPSTRTCPHPQNLAANEHCLEQCTFKHSILRPDVCLKRLRDESSHHKTLAPSSKNGRPLFRILRKDSSRSERDPDWEFRSQCRVWAHRYHHVLKESTCIKIVLESVDAGPGEFISLSSSKT